MPKIIFEFLIAFYTDGKMELRLVDSLDEEDDFIRVGDIEGHPIYLYEDKIRVVDYHKFSDLNYLCKIDDKIVVEFKKDIIIKLPYGDNVTILNFGKICTFSF